MICKIFLASDGFNSIGFEYRDYEWLISMYWFEQCAVHNNTCAVYHEFLCWAKKDETEWAKDMRIECHNTTYIRVAYFFLSAIFWYNSGTLIKLYCFGKVVSDLGCE